MQGDYWPLAGPARARGGRTTARARVRAGTIIVWSFFVFVLGRSVILVKLVQNRPSISTPTSFQSFAASNYVFHTNIIHEIHYTRKNIKNNKNRNKNSMLIQQQQVGICQRS